MIAEIALLRMKNEEKESNNDSQQSKRKNKHKCIYIAPLKSLAKERLNEWRKKFPFWNILEYTGDTSYDRNTLNNADVLICTPEKWDLVTRGWRNTKTNNNSYGKGSKGGIKELELFSKDYIKNVRLMILDEIHLLGEERGAVLEAIVSRTRYISKILKQQTSSNDENDMIRLIGLSTALANPSDLANWIGIDTNTNIGLYNFRPAVRPCPMVVHFQGFSGRHYCPRMATMNKPCYTAIKEHSLGKPVLIFVASRRQTRLTAIELISYAAGDDNPRAFIRDNDDGTNDAILAVAVETVSDKALRHTLSFGIGLHHAGLTSRDREIVERLYVDGILQVLVATATLAWGVNLPAYLVIVKGTEFFDGKTSRYVDYPITDVLQMIGRAGRPKFDIKGMFFYSIHWIMNWTILTFQILLFNQFSISLPIHRCCVLQL